MPSQIHILFSFLNRFDYARAWGSVLLGCCLPQGCKDIAQLLSLPLGPDVCPHAFLDELQGPRVLGDLAQMPGLLLTGGKAMPPGSCPA